MSPKSPKAQQPPKLEKSSLEMFEDAYRKAMAKEAAELEKMPKVFSPPEEGLVEIIDADDKHFGVP